MNDIECYLHALHRFAGLSPAEQRQLIADVRDGRRSKPAVRAVRELLAEAVDGCEDEEIADALRGGIDSEALPPATPKEIVAQAISQIRTLEDLEEVHALIGDEVLKAIGRA